ncbi:MAG: haloacid dehalogenase-like hydrolase [Myxococcales bacterium]|nr:haloacid dehalogenase-like hydrolase [Myxococcales bacterium]
MAGLDLLPPSVQAAVRPFLDSDAPQIAVFDADGTLWRGDVGEDLLRYLAATRLVVSDAYARYDALVEHAPVEAYGYAVQVMAGLREAELQAVCTTFFAQRYFGRVFPFVRPLFDVLRHAAVTPWLCSASPRWIVEAGAKVLGVEPEHVIGVDAEVEAGVLTDRLRLPVTAGPGKVEWLSRRGVTPGFSAGNGELDLDMLQAARHRLVIAPPDGVENGLVRHARRSGWPILKT